MSVIFGSTHSRLRREFDVPRSGNASQKFKPLSASPLVALFATAALAIGAAWPSTGLAQPESQNAKESNAHAEHKAMPSAADQKHDMGATGGAKKSEWWYDNYARGRKSSMEGMEGMSGMKGMTKEEMSADSPAGNVSSSGMQMKNENAGIMGMRNNDATTTEMGAVGGAGSMNMNGMREMRMASAQSGVPGVSRIYHIGATGFFLDHSEHLRLSIKQQAELRVVQQKALLSKATAQRRIEEAEQKLWELTGSDDPEAAKIEATVQDIEKLRGEQRLAFIRSVAEAARGLTEDQRAILRGTKENEADRKDSPDAK